MKLHRAHLVLVLFAILAATSVSPAAEAGFRGWGPRVGVSEDPDQIFVGAHFDLGDIVDNLRMQPNVELGFGDDTTAFFGSFMVAYYFPVEAKVTPYAGGQVTVAYYNLDDDCGGFGESFGKPGECDSSETEIGPMAVGGIEMKLSGKTRFFAELQAGFSDLPDFRLLAGWTF